MNTLLKEMDNQMLKWVQELDELHIKEASLDGATQELEELIDNAKKIIQRIKDNPN